MIHESAFEGERKQGEKRFRCQARGIKKSFGNHQILRGIHLDIEEGSFTVLVGPSGCGKSTLLRVVAGLEQVDEGELFLEGREVTTLPPRERDIAMVFQSYALYPHLTVRENLAFGLRLRGTAEDLLRERVMEASTMLGLEALLDRFPRQLSGGQRQRVAMGRAIVRRAKMYLFDEPLSNLDAALRGEVRVEIRKLHDRLGATTLYVTHDQVEAMTLADRLWVLREGEVVQEGPPMEVYERPNCLFVASFLGTPKINILPLSTRSCGNKTELFDEKNEVSLFIERKDIPEKIFFGVRPQHLQIGGKNPFAKLRVDVVEALGSEGYVHGWIGDHYLTLRVESERIKSIHSQQMIDLSVEESYIHLFDQKTEKSI